MQFGHGVETRKDWRQPLGPASNARLVGDQVLAHLDQGVGNARHHAVPEHGIPAQRTVIGFVVADDDIARRL
ncbi:hypothetical protein D9M72_568150 [compost metagenome]